MADVPRDGEGDCDLLRGEAAVHEAQAAVHEAQATVHEAQAAGAQLKALLTAWRSTPPLTNMEVSRVIGVRAVQLAAGALPLAPLDPAAPWDPVRLAEREFRTGALATILQALRYRPGREPLRLPAAPPTAHDVAAARITGPGRLYADVTDM